MRGASSHLLESVLTFCMLHKSVKKGVFSRLYASVWPGKICGAIAYALGKIDEENTFKYNGNLLKLEYKFLFLCLKL